MSKHAKKQPIFYVIAICLPFFLLLFLEICLRAFNFKPQAPLFVEVNNIPGYLQPNPNVIHRFFPSPDMAPSVSPDTQYFLKDKPDDSLRIVVQGGSTAAGFPYGRWGSLSGMLQQQFKRLYPEKNIEIINTAMASVNTYTLLDFVDEIIEIEPDIILIYAGHNEYLGVMGVGSAYASRGGRSANLLYLTMKDLKLFRLVEGIYYAFKGHSNSSTNPTDERTLMATVAKDKDIPYKSDLFLKGIEQFSGNLALILATYQQHNIPVVIGDLVSNEKDLIPFSAVSTTSVKEIQALALTSKKDRSVLANQYYQAIVNPNNDKRNLAREYYLYGHALKLAGNHSQSKEAFITAKDYDTLRFRAPSEFNQVIEQQAQRFGAMIAGVQEAFFADSEDGIIGQKHMLEHLHPSQRGYFILAKAYVDSLQRHGLLPQITGYNLEAAWFEQPISKADAAYGQFKVNRLTADYPFTEIPKQVELPPLDTIEHKMLNERVKGREWLSINQDLLSYYQQQQDFPEAAKIAGLLADALPNKTELLFIAGMLYKKAQNLPLSVHYLNKAVKTQVNPVQARLSLAQNYYLLGEPAKSLALLKAAKLLQPNHPQIDNLIRIVEK